MKGIKKFLFKVWFHIYYSKTLREMYYALKAFFSILGGFDELQYKDSEGEWRGVGNDFVSHPFYVCPVFYSGRHIPLPFFTDPNANIGRLQLQAIKLASRLNPGSYKAAQEACAWYQLEWDKENRIRQEEDFCYEPIPEPGPILDRVLGDDEEPEPVEVVLPDGRKGVQVVDDHEANLGDVAGGFKIQE